MKNLIMCHKLYGDPTELNALISNMEFQPNLYGDEIKDFQYIPNGLQDFFSSLLNESVEIQPDTGIFRKPVPFVHFENFYQHSLWLCIVALEDTTLYLNSDSDKQTFFDVKNCDAEYLMTAQWHTDCMINIKQNDYVFIRPWRFHSLSEGKLIQLFMLNQLVK